MPNIETPAQNSNTFALPRQSSETKVLSLVSIARSIEAEANHENPL